MAVDAEHVVRQLVLAVQRGVEHARVVGVEGDDHTGLAERRERMVLDPSDRPGAQVGRRAHLERDRVLGQVGHERRLLDR